MTIYNLNMGIGWASSGVEYAQAYRNNIFRKNKQDAKFIFTDLFTENLEPMTKNLGFEDKDVIWLYQYFTDVVVKPTQFTRRRFENSLTDEHFTRNQNGEVITYTFKDSGIKVIAFLDTHQTDETDVIYKTELIINGNLIQRDYYSYVKMFSEYFKPVNGSANLYQRRFFNENGSTAYDELLNGDESLFVFGDKTVYSKEKLIALFFKSLNLTENDIILIDRSTGMGPQVIQEKGAAKIGVVIHAEHFNEPMTNDEHILWNNYYDYQFENAASIDFFVTATKIQKELLENQFERYGKGPIKIYAIPVGSIDRLQTKKKRKAHSLVTASRLASEKHLDWLVCAVAESHETIEDLTLDIYGRGGEEAMLRDLIAELGAEEYIHLKGHRDLTKIYKNYSAYISTSTSEGFGLTLLEAVGSGLPMIGFDVRYGNQTFIKNGKNGYLVEYHNHDKVTDIENISLAISSLMASDKKLAQASQWSYKIAEPFLTKHIQTQWIELEKEVTNA